MNDTASLLLATTILGICGLGLIMYKSTDSDNDDTETHKNEQSEDTFFGLEKFWSSSDDEDSLQEDVEIYEPKVSSRVSKTKRNRKTTGSRRKY